MLERANDSAPPLGTQHSALGTPPPLAVECAVAWWQPLARDLFSLGGQFVRVLSGVAVPDVAPRVVLPGLVGTEDGADLVAPLPLQRAAS